VPRTFDCPKCGAPVEFSNNPGQPDRVTCNYCNSVLAEPTMGRPAQIIQLKIDPIPGSTRFPKWILLTLLIPVLAVGTGIVAMIAGMTPFFHSKPREPSRVATVPGGGTRPEPSIANVTLKFGSEGIGPGMFTDARSIAVDGAGNIYVGEYSGGRIQVFDSNGKFITQWIANAKMPLRGLAADRTGNVFVVQSGNIQKFEGLSGKPLGQMSYGEGWGFDDIVTTPDGGLTAAWYKNRDDIVRFDASGHTVRTIKAAISSITDHSELDTRIAEDGLGNIYALGRFNNAVFKFGRDGKYINKFGSAGDKAGQLQAPVAIAIDGKGRVFVADMKGIQMFDSDGRYLNVFKPDNGHASGMIFNDKGELYVVDRTKVVKVVLKE
jgi:streptogramin lyase/ribosomal protein S27E